MATQLNFFQSVQDFYRVMGIYPTETNQKFPLLLKRFFFGVSTISTFCALIAFLLLEAQTVDQYASAFHGSISELCQMISFLISVWQMSIVLKLIEHFNEFVAKSEQIFEPQIFRIYFYFSPCRSWGKYTIKSAVHWYHWTHRTDVKAIPFHRSKSIIFRFDDAAAAEQLHRLFSLWFEGRIVSIAIWWMVRANAKMFQVFNLSPLILGSNLRYPFNWRTPFGYGVALLSQCGSSFVILYNICPIICFLIGTCWVLIGCCEDISNELPHLNTIKEPRRNGCGELKASICSVAQMLADVKQFSDLQMRNQWFIIFMCSIFLPISFSFVNEFNVVNRFHCLIDFSWSLLAVSCSLLACLVLLVEW